MNSRYKKTLLEIPQRKSELEREKESDIEREISQDVVAFLLCSCADCRYEHSAIKSFM